MYVNNPADNQVSLVDRRSKRLAGAGLSLWAIVMLLWLSTPQIIVVRRLPKCVIVVLATTIGKDLQTFAIGKGVDDLAFNPAPIGSMLRAVEMT